MEQLFRSRTDENHAITGNQLIDILGDMGIKAERKTIYDDIATLNDAGLNIQTTKIGHSNAYYMGDRLFDDEELAVICDAGIVGIEGVDNIADDALTDERTYSVVED